MIPRSARRVAARDRKIRKDQQQRDPLPFFASSR